MRSTRFVLVAAVVSASSLSAPTAAGDPPPAPWEQEVERETEAQNLLLDHARRQKSVPAVVATYESRVGRDPSPLNHFLLGRARFYNEDVTGARMQMNLALEGDRGFWPAHVKLARLAVDLKNWAEADAQVRAALLARPSDAEALEVSAQIGVGQKDWPRAIRAYEALLARDPENLGMRKNLALVHLMRGDFDAELRELEVWRTRDPRGLDVRRLIALCWKEKGDFPKAAAKLEELLAEPALEVQPKLVLLDDLRSVYVKMRDRDKMRAVLERMLPLLLPDQQKAVSEMIEQLRKPPDVAKEGEPKSIPPSELAAMLDSPDPAKRRQALQLLYEACRLGYVQQIPGTVLRRVASDNEPDVECRSWVVKIMGQLTPQILPLLSYALYDEAKEVRMLAADSIGDMKRPVGIAYLLPFVRTEGLDLSELNSVRAALSMITSFRDLPLGEDRVTTEAGAAADRETWRRWLLSDASTALKLAAVRELRSIDHSSPEKFLYDFVMDPTFDVMREAYFAMRAAVAREPRDAAEKKVFPQFPVVPDDQVTREGMRGIQDRVAAWWGIWIAEHRALLQAKGK